MHDASAIPHQFDDRTQQWESAELGIWIFLVTEVLFFGGLFLGYAVYRHFYTDGFMEAGKETVLWIGTVNTVLIVTSSMFAAIAVKAARLGRLRLMNGLVMVVVALALMFLALKGYEYHHDIVHHTVPGDPEFPVHKTGAQIFFSFYWVMTGLHAVHMAIGIGTWIAVLLLARYRKLDPVNGAAVHVTGLYWSFVDMMWLFLYPLLYLVGRSG